MKKLIILSMVLTIIACNKEDDSTNYKQSSCTKSEESFNDKGATLSLTSQEWVVEENNIGGVDVSVSIVGSIQGDSATIRTYGDGLISNNKIELDSENEFNLKTGIFFTSSPPSEEYIIASTMIMVFNGQDTLKVGINSCPLENVQYQ